MKKLIIIGLILQVITIIILTMFVSFFNRIDNNNVKIDTTYNKVLIDSIQLNITRTESTIVEYNKILNYEMDKANNLSNDSAVLLFRELLQGE